MAENRKKRPRGSEVDRTAKKRRRLSRICIGVAFPRWRALKEEIGLMSNTDIAVIPLDK